MKKETKKGIELLTHQEGQEDADAMVRLMQKHRCLVVLDRGWVFVGYLFRYHGNYHMSEVQNVRRWQKEGFGGLTQGAKFAQATLDKCEDLYFAPSALIFYVPVTENWEND